MNIQLTLRPGEDEKKLAVLCKKKYGKVPKYIRILKKSLDARDKGDIKWVYSVQCSEEEEREAAPSFPQVKKSPRVVVAGAGPAGLFCALRLLDFGIRPVVVERGKPVEERERDVERFCAGGPFSPESNVQFGEGGAGTFSDGKLFTQTNGPLNREVIRLFLRYGAPAEIGYLAKPHIGSDRLRAVVRAMREDILARGGEVRFRTKLTDITMRENKLVSVEAGGEKEEADELVLAVGHSARDTFEMLLSGGFLLEQKEFAAGVRIEHLQERIGEAQYGRMFRSLPPADYKLVSHAGERDVFTFCMCPGGFVIPSASEEGGVVVNGMSNFSRDGLNANSALVAQVRREDMGEGPLAGVELQRKMERAAYLAAGGAFRAPVQRAEDFLLGRESSSFGDVSPTYARGTAFAPLESYLPAPIVRSLRAALPDLDRRLKGFSHGLFTGVESRTSSPVRVVRGSDLQAAGKEGVWPCGEGCGYAGGITSSAADGLRIAEAIARKYL